MKRDCDFKARTKSILAKRSGYRCNNPECRRMTVGAHSDPNKFVSLGQACHIEAASPGGPRYNPALSTEERQKVSNGIWLCYSCAKLIDSDPDRFTVDVLNSWKALAEDWNLRDAAMQSIPESTRIISITNVAGGTGKSTATAMISQVISSQMHKRVLCVSVHESDHAIYFLNGRNLDDIRRRRQEKKKADVPLAPVSPLEVCGEVIQMEYGVDVLPFQSLYNLTFQQRLCFGESSVKEVFAILSTVCGYNVIVCDCGRGDGNLQKAILNISTDIVVPTGKRCFFDSTILFLTEFGLKSSTRKNVWFFMSTGINKYVAEDLLPQIEKLQVENAHMHMIDTVVPYNSNMDSKDCKVPKNVISAYGRIAQLILQGNRTTAT